MLVLSRKIGERIVIGNNVVLTVVEVQGDRVKLGFTASHSVPIDREEVHARRRADMPREPVLDEEASPFFAECA